MHYLNKKITYHQILFLCLSLVIIFSYSGNIESNYLSAFNLPSPIFWSFVMIATIGMGHGALDGKIIWDSTNNRVFKLKIYCIYIGIVMFGLIFWFVSPFISLIILLLMSLVHFGESDMQGYKTTKFENIFWGIIVTLIPVVFKTEEVNNIFLQLAGLQINSLIHSFIVIIFVFAILFWSKILFQKKLFLLAASLSIMMLAGYLLHPLVWFAYYFCFFHGMKAIINYSINLKLDILWMLLFTAPVLLVWCYLNFYTKTSIILLIFPTLFALTIAHMMLKNIIKKVLV
jgi:Brp/Blh family beta-carotene 15,15'-monooxygenase